MRAWLRWVVMAASLFAPGAFAQGASSREHAWAVIPTGNDEAPALLVHLPPRAARSAADRGAPPGSLRKVQTFGAMPLGLAAIEGDVILAFSAHASDAAKRQVLSTTARPAEAFGQWYYEPVGRLRTLPPLPDDGELLAVAEGAPGPVALLRQGGESSGRYEILTLTRDRWHTLPAPALAPGDRPRLVGDIGGVSLIVPRTGETVWWRTSVAPPDPADGTAGESDGGAALQCNWTPTTLAPAPENAHADYFVMDDGVLVVTRSPEARHLDRLLPKTRMPLARIEGVPADAVPVPLRESESLALIWVERGSGTPRIVEISTLTGEVRFEGAARLAGPVSPGEFRIIALAMVVVMTAVLLFLLRRDPEPIAIRLPEDAVLCPPFVRLAATSVDALLALGLAAVLLGASIGDLVSLRMLASDEPARWGLFLAIGIGWGASTVLEGRFGLTPGKFLVGARVLRVDGTMQALGLGRAAVRNACKWFAPPLAMLAAFAPDFRHRGDVLAGACVASRRPPAARSDRGDGGESS
ncbi:MAG: RDD family protein [Phycisphaerales bacterium]|nr:RDD family protein [Phycisphaerales bacterium]